MKVCIRFLKLTFYLKYYSMHCVRHAFAFQGTKVRLELSKHKTGLHKKFYFIQRDGKNVFYE